MTDVLTRLDRFSKLGLVHNYDDGGKISDAEKREIYKSNLKLVRSFADGVEVQKICAERKVSRQRMYQILARHEELGRAGLIHYAQSGTRNVDIKLLASEVPRANAQAALWKKFPKVYEAMVEAIESEAFRGEGKSKKNLTIPALRSYLATLLQEARQPLIDQGLEDPDQWKSEFPASSPDGGARALARLASSIREARRARKKRLEEEERGRRGAADAFNCGSRFYRDVEMDGHAVDCNWIVEMDDPVSCGKVRLQVTRLWLIPVIERKSGACLGWTYSLNRKNYAGEDMCTALRNSQAPWKPRNLKITGITYKAGECMPNAYMPQLAWRCWDVLHLDNDKAHLADMFLTAIEHSVGCVVRYGPAGAPNVRPKVEKIFDLLEEAGIHPIPASFGSSLVNLTLAERKKAPYVIKLEVLLDLLDILLCRWNASCPPDCNETRLEILAREIREEQSLPRYMPESERARVERYDLRLAARIGRKKGHPVVRLDADYDGGALNKHPGLFGKWVYIDLDSRDVRTVHAYLMETGEDLGELIVEKRYRAVAHSFRTRKYAKNVSKHNRFSQQVGDVIVAARHHCHSLAAKGIKSAEAAAARMAHEAIEAARRAQGTDTDAGRQGTPHLGASQQAASQTLRSHEQEPQVTSGAPVANRKLTEAEVARMVNLGTVY